MYIETLSYIHCEQMFVDLEDNPTANTKAVTIWMSIPCLWVVCFYFMSIYYMNSMYLHVYIPSILMYIFHVYSVRQ